jgi:L-ascorbate metabolism protein UlaG (beta-lactamase superfamily)
MAPVDIRLTYVGGPTALLELRGRRYLTDPTLDPAPADYPTPAYTLHKSQAPAVAEASLLPLHGILLSHDHHFDNLDHRGRALLAQAETVYTTVAGAERVGGNAEGLAPWESRSLPGGGRLVAAPARHGPAGGDRGPVIGFVLEPEPGAPGIYISGDSVQYEGVFEVGRRFAPGVALLNLGAARVAVAGPLPLTFTAAEAVELARAWPETTIVPLHFEGWAHFSEGRREVEHAFAAAGLSPRLRWLSPGVPETLSLR